MRYLEYELSSGHIISEIISETEPETSEGFGVIAIGENDVVAKAKYIVKNGVLTKAYETKNEQLERERLRKEQRAKCLLRIKSMVVEDFVARMKHDDEAIKELEKEYASFESYL